jgi:hypothetical protein
MATGKMTGDRWAQGGQKWRADKYMYRTPVCIKYISSGRPTLSECDRLLLMLDDNIKICGCDKLGCSPKVSPTV